MSSSSSPYTGKDISSYIDLLNESVHTSDDNDIGDIEAVSKDFIVIKRGFLNVHYYYIPIHNVEGWDGKVLWLKITEEQVKQKYERNIIPNPNKYYLKDFPYYDTAYFPTLAMIPPKYPPNIYGNIVKADKIYECDLCTRSFDGEKHLSKHVEKEHN